MFCYQCEQTAKGEGCTRMGVCGKDPTAANIMDVLIELCKEIGTYSHLLRQHGQTDLEADRFIQDAMFATLTNTNFDQIALAALLQDAERYRDHIRGQYEQHAGENAEKIPNLEPIPADVPALAAMGEQIDIGKRQEQLGPDVTGLQELIIYGLKGSAAYAHHARVLGKEDDEIHAFFAEALAFLKRGENTNVEKLVDMAMRVGKNNLRVMELLDEANTGAYGHPEPTTVRVTPVAGKAIVVSGHDLKDLEELLKQTEGKGINVYTHGEMLPCLAYPELKKYPHLVGNYGGAWQNQTKEFDEFPGAILMTTNCIQKPKPTYHDRIFTSGPTGWPDVTHIENRDFTPVIEAALAAPGFAEDAEEKTITIGFGHNAVLSVAETVVNAVKNGAIRHFFLIGGCDGAKPGRNYYTEFAQAVPEDCVMLTLACGKYRFNKLPFGKIDGIPRLLDCGQCNDAYSAIKIAQALAEAFECDVNDLPLSMILSWYEQKAVCILLTLLYLGIQDMRIGPSLPAFLGPNVLNVLVEQFGLKPIAAPTEDLQAILAEPATA
jgi:hydroxylamine reductase